MSHPLVARRCIAAVQKDGRRVQCGNTVKVLPDERNPRCHLHGDFGGNPMDKRFNEVHTGGKYSWAVKRYPSNDPRMIGGTSSGIQIARRDLAKATKPMLRAGVLPMFAEAVAMDAQESWTDFPEYGVTVKLWRIS